MVRWIDNFIPYICLKKVQNTLYLFIYFYLMKYLEMPSRIYRPTRHS